MSIIFPGVHFSGGTHPNAKKLFFKSLGFLTQSNNENAGVDFLNLRYEITTANSKELSTFRSNASMHSMLLNFKAELQRRFFEDFW